MDDEVIGGFRDDGIAPFALEQPDRSTVEDAVDANPDVMYAVPGQALIDIADAIRTKRDMVGAISVEDMPMEIGLIGGGGIATGDILYNGPTISTWGDAKAWIESLPQFKKDLVMIAEQDYGVNSLGMVVYASGPSRAQYGTNVDTGFNGTINGWTTVDTVTVIVPSGARFKYFYIYDTEDV